jgi:hypothetical protein
MELVRKCCMCRRVWVGSARGGPGRWMVRDSAGEATHGYCPSCYQAELDRLSRNLRVVPMSGGGVAVYRARPTAGGRGPGAA